MFVSAPPAPSVRWFRLWVLAVLGLTLAGPAQAAEVLDFDAMYTESVRGLKFTPRLVGLAGKQVAIKGFMAPLLRVQSDFFVLTRDPVSLCPFCNSDTDWPADIVVVYFKTGQIFRQLNHAIEVSGRLEIGSFTDGGTGFVSLVRLVDAEILGS